MDKKVYGAIIATCIAILMASVAYATVSTVYLTTTVTGTVGVPNVTMSPSILNFGTSLVAGHRYTLNATLYNGGSVGTPPLYLNTSEVTNDFTLSWNVTTPSIPKWGTLGVEFTLTVPSDATAGTFAFPIAIYGA